MDRRILVADDKGYCFTEIKALVPAGVECVRSSGMDDCITRMRENPFQVLMVAAAMPQAFSLIRIVRKSRDLASVPLVVLAEAGQESLIEKHGQLPTRADRYLLRPLDRELLAGILDELAAVGPQPTVTFGAPPRPSPPPMPVIPSVPPEAIPETPGFGDFMHGAPEAMQRIQDELRRSRENIGALEKDLHLALASSKHMAALREENRLLRQRLKSFEEQARSARDYSSIFERLEKGYKDTIADLERLIGEKDRMVAELREQSPIGADTATLERMEEAGRRISKMQEGLRRAVGIVESMEAHLDDLDLDEIARLNAAIDAGDSVSFSDDESTQVVDLRSLDDKSFDF